MARNPPRWNPPAQRATPNVLPAQWQCELPCRHHIPRPTARLQSQLPCGAPLVPSAASMMGSGYRSKAWYFLKRRPARLTWVLNCLGPANQEDGDRRFSNYLLGVAAHGNANESAASVGAHNDQI